MSLQRARRMVSHGGLLRLVLGLTLVATAAAALTRSAGRSAHAEDSPVIAASVLPDGQLSVVGRNFAPGSVVTIRTDVQVCTAPPKPIPPATPESDHCTWSVVNLGTTHASEAAWTWICTPGYACVDAQTAPGGAISWASVVCDQRLSMPVYAVDTTGRRSNTVTVSTVQWSMCWAPHL
jgi:hypothetical protein